MRDELHKSIMGKSTKKNQMREELERKSAVKGRVEEDKGKIFKKITCS